MASWFLFTHILYDVLGVYFVFPLFFSLQLRLCSISLQLFPCLSSLFSLFSNVETIIEYSGIQYRYNSLTCTRRAIVSVLAAYRSIVICYCYDIVGMFSLHIISLTRPLSCYKLFESSFFSPLFLSVEIASSLHLNHCFVPFIRLFVSVRRLLALRLQGSLKS